MPVDVRCRVAALPRRVARAVLRAVLAARLPLAGHGVRADGATPSARTTRRSTRSRSSTRWSRRCASAGRFALRVLPDAPSAMRAGDRRARVLDRAARRRATCRCRDAAAAACSTASLATADATAARPRSGRARGPAIAQGRPRPEVRRHRARAPRRRRCAGLELDTMIASYLLDATRSAHPLEDSRSSTLGYKALSEEDVCGRGAKALSFAQLPVAAALDFAGERADLALQLAPALRRDLDREGARRASTRRSSMPLIPVLVAIERAGVRVDGAALAAQSQRIERELDALARAHLRAGGRGVQHQLAEAARRGPVRQAAAAGRCKRTGKTQGAVDGGRGARGAGADARAAAARARVARPAEAEGHLHRRAAAARASGHRPRAHVLQPGGRGDRPA